MESEKTGTGEFFMVRYSYLREIVLLDGGVEELIAYIILSRGAGSFTTSFWSDNAVKKYGGLRFDRAKSACAWLEKNGFIRLHRKYHETVAQINREKLASREQRVDSAGNPLAAPEKTRMCQKWILAELDETTANVPFDLNLSDEIYLPNQIVNGFKKGPKYYPLGKLYNGVHTSPEDGINTDAARLDALMLLVRLYMHHNIQKWGGVNPRVWRGEWNNETTDEHRWTPIPDTNYFLVEIVEGAKIFDEDYDEELLFFVVPMKRKNHFHLAMRNLRKFGFVYEALQVWDADPLDCSDTKPAILLYPLHSYNAHARAQNEPFLSDAINALCEMVYDPEDIENGIRGVTHSGFFRYIEHQDLDACALAALRLRYRAHDHDTGVGFEAQRSLVRDWQEIIDASRDLQQA